MSPNVSGPITALLANIDGSREALDELLPLVYAELRRLANGKISQERSSHTLQPTALVHEAYLRLVKLDSMKFENQAHFFGIAARLMREILIDHARSKHRKKRGGARTHISVDDAASLGEPTRQLDVMEVDEALNRLEELDHRQARIVEMKFFGGMKIEEIAACLDLSPATVKREWTSAKLFLSNLLN